MITAMQHDNKHEPYSAYKNLLLASKSKSAFFFPVKKKRKKEKKTFLVVFFLLIVLWFFSHFFLFFFTFHAASQLLLKSLKYDYVNKTSHIPWSEVCTLNETMFPHSIWQWLKSPFNLRYVTSSNFINWIWQIKAEYVEVWKETISPKIEVDQCFGLSVNQGGLGGGWLTVHPHISAPLVTNLPVAVAPYEIIT